MWMTLTRATGMYNRSYVAPLDHAAVIVVTIDVIYSTL